MAPTSGVVLIAFVLTVAGCASPAPIADNFPISYQKVARTAQHWNIVADDVVNQTSKVLASTPALQGRGIYVPSTPRNSAFDATFRDFMINHLVDRGASVSVCPSPKGPGFATSPDIEIRYETRIIGHGELPQYRPGILTALAAGVFVARGVDHADLSNDALNLVGLGAGAFADWAMGHRARTPSTEIVVTTHIEENNRFVMRRSDIYYVPEADANLFIRRVAGSAACQNADNRSDLKENKLVQDEQARREIMVREMRRINPEWRPSNISTFAY